MIKRLSFVLGAVVLLLFSSTMIQAQAFLVIPSPAFRPHDDTVAFFYYWDYSWVDSGGSGTFYAPVYLPQDATIISVTFTFTDTDASNDLSFSVIRTNIYTGAYQTLFSGSSSGSGGFGTTVDSSLNAGSRVVKNNSFSYVARIDVPSPGGSSLKFWSVKIKYQ